MSDEVTGEMIDAAWAVLTEEWTPPYMARTASYVSEGSAGAEREAELSALRAADQDAERRSRDLIRRALAAALSAR